MSGHRTGTVDRIICPDVVNKGLKPHHDVANAICYAFCVNVYLYVTLNPKKYDLEKDQIKSQMSKFGLA